MCLVWIYLITLYLLIDLISSECCNPLLYILKLVCQLLPRLVRSLLLSVLGQLSVLALVVEGVCAIAEIETLPSTLLAFGLDGARETGHPLQTEPAIQAD